MDHRNRKWLITSVVCQIWLHGGSADVFTSTHGWISGLSSWDILCSYMRIWTSLNGLWNEIEIVWASICVVLLRFQLVSQCLCKWPRRSISALKSSWREFVSHAAEMMHWFHRHEGEKQTLAFSFYQPLGDIWAVSGLICEESKRRSLIICFMNDNPSRSTLFSLLWNYKYICPLYFTLKSDLTQVH